MIFVFFGILVTLVQLAVVVGVVVLIVRRVSDRNKTSPESVSIMIRRFFVYSISLVMLVLGGFGIAGLIDAAWPGGGALVDSSTQAAISIAFVVVTVPVYFGLALYIRKQLRVDPTEQGSLGWAAYISIALTGTLLAWMSVATIVLSDLVGGAGIDRRAVIRAVVWSAIWAGHWWVVQRRRPTRAPQIYLLLGSAVALIWTFVGAFWTIDATLSVVYDKLFVVATIDRGIGELLDPFVVVVVGLPMWLWHWLGHARRGERTPWWLAYVLLLGVLGGAVAVISGAGIALFGVLDWVLGDPSASAARHFEFLPGAATAGIVGVGTWTYHARLLGDRHEVARTEVGRVYDYLLAAAGLIVAASGVTTLLTMAIKMLSGTPIIGSNSGSTLAVAITLIAVGAPLWWHYWSIIQRARATDTVAELESVTRRIYILVLFGITAVVAVINLIIVVFMVFRDVLESTFGSGTLRSAAVPLALLLTAGTLVVYHWAILKEDRTDLAGTEEESEIKEEPAMQHVVPRGSLEETLKQLADSGQLQTTVMWHEDGFEIKSRP